MKDQSNSPLDHALDCVPRDRRKFIGMLLAGVVAAPLLATTVLTEESSAETQKTPAQHKNSAQQKNLKAATSGQKSPSGPIKFKAGTAQAAQKNQKALKANSTAPK